MKQAKAADVHIVDEEFLDDVGKTPATVPQLIVQHSIATWGSHVSCPLCLSYTAPGKISWNLKCLLEISWNFIDAPRKFFIISKVISVRQVHFITQ